jgi:hypothetical protein
VNIISVGPSPPGWPPLPPPRGSMQMNGDRHGVDPEEEAACELVAARWAAIRDHRR